MFHRIIGTFLFIRLVPKSLHSALLFRTKTGAKFKSRALQYCLEKDVNILRDNDWIVHLDEETLMTVNSVHGILNFCEDGNHQFGQGVITYGQGEVVNWLTTLCDSFRYIDKSLSTIKLFNNKIQGC